MQRQRRHGREDQREQVIEEMPDVEQQEVQALAHGKALLVRTLPARCAAQASAFARLANRGAHGWVDNRGREGVARRSCFVVEFPAARVWEELRMSSAAIERLGGIANEDHGWSIAAAFST